MFSLNPPDRETLERILAQARDGAPTYEQIGTTQEADLPHGFRHDRHQVLIEGQNGFELAKRGLLTWQEHVGAGASVYPDTPVVADATVLTTFRLGLLYVVAPCRVVYVIDEPGRFGWAYGTLAGHPESGEESFVIERSGSHATTFNIVAFSKPAGALSRPGGPVTRWLQLRMTHRYLDGLKSYVLASS